MFRLIILFLLSGTTLCAQQTVLPYFREGKWGLIDTTGKELTKTPYEYIHTFDQQHTTFYASESRFGVLNDQGVELTPNEFDDVVQLGYGKYNVKKNDEWTIISFLDGEREEFLKANEATFEPLSEVWLEMNLKGKKSFINLKSKSTIEPPDTLRSYSVWYDFLFVSTKKGLFVCKPDGDTLIYDQKTLETEGGGSYFYPYEMARIISTQGATYLIDEHGLWTLPATDNFYCYDTDLFIQLGSTGKLYDRPTRSVLLEGPYTYITSRDENYWYVDNDMTGASNLVSKKTKKPIFPASTRNFMEIKQGYVLYDANGLCQVVDKQIRSLIPGKFTSVRFTGNDLVYLYVNEAQGLYSMKTKKYILPSIYSEITNTKDRYKGIFKDNYTIVQLDKTHKIINRIDGKNNLYVPTRSLNPRKQYFDPRLFPMGWFVDSSDVLTKEDETVTLYKWGLKDQNDSLILKPLLGNLNYVIGPFAYSKSRPKLMTLPDGMQYNACYLQFYAHNTGKQAGPSNVLWCDTLDFMTRSFMRLYTGKGYGFLSDSGTYKPALYIQLDESPFLRYCYEGGMEPTKDTKEKLTTEIQPCLVMSQGPNAMDAQAIALYKQNYRNSSEYRNKYPGGKWNYLNPSGENLFKEPFDFAFEFVGSCAIAVRDGKWGVVSKDTVIVPFLYKHIERVVKGTDTLFITELAPRGNRYLDTTLNALALQDYLKSSSVFNVVQIAGQQHIWNSVYADIVEPQANFKLYNGGYFSYKKDKQIHLHDSTGTLLCSTKRKIERVLGNSYFIFEDGSNVGVADFSDKEILAPEQFEITEFENAFLVAGRNGSTVYNLQFKPVLTIEEGSLLIDPVTQKIAHLNDGKVTVYSPLGKKMTRLKDVKPIVFHNNAFLIKGKTLQIIDLEGTLLSEIADMEGTMVFPNNWFCIKSDKRGWLLFNDQWKEVQPKTLPARHISYHGGNTFSFWDKSVRYTVVNYDNNKQIGNLIDIAGNIEEGSLLVKEINNAYFIDANMEPINRFHYLDAMPYKNGYAAVRDSRGWTLVNRDSKPVTYPSFPAIEHKGPNLYACQKQSVYGLYNTQGKQLIPNTNERLTFVKPTIVQCVSMGEVFYYTKSGQKLF